MKLFRSKILEHFHKKTCLDLRPDKTQTSLRIKPLENFGLTILTISLISDAKSNGAVECTR